ncbi:MAG: iron-containing alcohol dehydrogenase [Candidatus Marinimicrobia bacterium]|nr:iron-containing alcohol dehydrogenase [Candidatus Neomarinimicrobiota bacterium]
MIRTTIFPGRYVQGAHVTNRLGDELERFGDHSYLIVDPYIYDNMLEQFTEPVQSVMQTEVAKFGGECSDTEIEKLSREARSNECNVIAGVGGGKTLDTAKAVAHELDLPVAIIPTTASTDAPCSALSVIYTENGEFDRYLFLPRNPDVVIMDSQIAAEAPARFLVSGMGDALATWIEAESCKQSYAKNFSGDYGSMTAYTLAELCYNTLLEYGVAAKKACERKTVTPALDRVVEANTLLSGLGFESGGIAAAHSIHNGLTVLNETHDYFHGEKVAIGVLASLILTDRTIEQFHTVREFCLSVGLPTTLADIGLKDPTADDLAKVAEAACAEGETIHNEPVPVTPDMVVSALKTLDEMAEMQTAA